MPPRAPPRPLVLLAIALAGCAAAACTVVLALSNDHLAQPGVRSALLVWTVLSYILAGLVAWWRRPNCRLGLLMVAVGFTSFLTGLQWANLALPYTLGAASDLLPPVLFLHVFLAFPTGRLDGWFERALIVAGYVIAVGLQLGVMTLGGFGTGNLLELASKPDAASLVQGVQLVALSAFSLAGIGVLVVRRRSAGRPLRRWVALLIDSFALGLLMVAFLLLSDVFGAPGETPHSSGSGGPRSSSSGSHRWRFLSACCRPAWRARPSASWLSSCAGIRRRETCGTHSRGRCATGRLNSPIGGRTLRPTSILMGVGWSWPTRMGGP
jgi:hypothetical protein